MSHENWRDCRSCLRINALRMRTVEDGKQVMVCVFCSAPPVPVVRPKKEVVK